MLLNNFFEILEETQGEAEVSVTKIKFNKDHNIFKGHFPSNPVVPGVCMIQMIKEMAERKLNRGLRLTKADNVKFLNMVNPHENEIVVFELNIKAAEGLSVKANVFSEGKTFLKFSGIFQ